MGRWKKHHMIRRICGYYQSILHQCLSHINNLYEKRYIFRHVYITHCKKIEEVQSHIDTFNLRELIQSMDTLVFSCGLPSTNAILEYLSIPPLASQHDWVNHIGFPIVISKERGGIGSSFFRAPAIIGQNSLENTRGVWMSVPGNSNVHYAIRLIIERDVLGLLPKAFSGKMRLIEKQEWIDILPEKYIITETANELRSRIDTMIKIRERLGKTPVGKVIREFMNADIPKQVKLFCSMMISENNQDLTHLLTILYDIHTNQTIVHRKNIPDLIDSLPWKVQQYIRELRNHKTRTDTITEDDIPDETKIQMLKTDKATIKLALSRLREAKTRGGGGGGGGIIGNDGASKAGAWVEGLLQIPFGIYRKEPILCLRDETYNIISGILGKSVSSLEDIHSQCLQRFSNYVFFHTEHQTLRWNRDTIVRALRTVPTLKQLRQIHLRGDKVASARSTRRKMVQDIVDSSINEPIPELYNRICQNGGSFDEQCQPVYMTLNEWNSHLHRLQEYLQTTHSILDTCIYRQERAKEQILRLLGQWMVGDNRGYCIGFEGPPGVGKTTLARDGIPKILADANGTPRPFHMIALGTATTGSTFVGHNYTYHGSTWGDIVRFLMDSQCMNPIIYIDELDKVSMTESGREIIGILTHLTDSAQNEEFQDRYFAGVKLDVSRILFIFSYNDPSKVDPILLDRIHRISFEPFTVSEKVEIVQNYTLPEIIKTLRLSGDCSMLTEDIRHIILQYTHEPGIRKLREILFDIYREVNLKKLHCGHGIRPTLKFVETHVLSHRPKPHRTIADCQSKVNRVFGMFATSSGMGGILPIRITKTVSRASKETTPGIILTGSLGDVMKESVRVARTVVEPFVTPDDLSGAGAHIHFPQGATPKDGPSAGAAIALALWSFYTGTEIPGNLAITGEIDLDGMVLPVGGIQEKLVGACADGIQVAYIPLANAREYEIARAKLPEQELPKRVEFLESFETLLQKIRNYE